MPLLALRQLTLAFGGPPLLDGIDLTIEAGERLCLLGRNGCGKSTLLKLLAGTLPPDGGEIQRPQGLKVALLDQEAPDYQGTIFDVVAGGMGEMAQLLADYHHTSLDLARRHDDATFKRLTELQRRLEAGGGWGLDQEVERLIKRLGLDPEADYATLSGGTRRRALLGRALIGRPDLLLLDEPTNHLDLDTILWLEEFLLKEVKSLVFVTHDRAFARKLANRVAEIDRGRIYAFSVGYDDFVLRREELLAAEITRQALFDKKLAAEEIWVRQGIKARRTRNEGRVRALKKLREERRQRRERQGTAKIELQSAERSGHLVAEAEKISYAWEGQPVIRDFSATILRGDKIGIIGPNGAGKTTLLRLLLGELQPQSGTLRLGTRREVLYVDQLRDQLDPDKSVQENVGEGNDTLVINGKPRHIIGYLQDFLFAPERARSPVRILSGGERNRLLLAKLFTKPANVLVLDEPTNDLDAETLDLLEELLVDYDGTVLLVSHDRDFLNNVVTSTLAFDYDGVVREYVGGYDDWLRQRPTAPPQPMAVSVAPAEKARGKSEKPRKLSFKEERELEALPARIAALEAEQEALHARLADPELYKSAAGEITVVNARLAELEGEIDDAMVRWDELETIRSGG